MAGIRATAIMAAVAIVTAGVASGAGATADGASIATAAPGRHLIRLAAGEERNVFGASYRAAVPTVAIVSLSSEFVTVAVVAGELARGDVAARGGQALVTPLDGVRTRRYGFDAARLAASLPPDWTADVQAPLQALTAGQRRARFWGLIEPAGVNASAPVGGAVETVRQSYLANATIIALRREARGNGQALAGLTVQRFAAALAARDGATVADLLDPKPFTDTESGAASWHVARRAFAEKLIGDAALVAGMADMARAAPGTAGAFRIQLIQRDRVLFVAGVEPLS